MHLRFNFDACPMHSPFGFVHLTHQNLSARALFCLNSLAKVNTQLLSINKHSVRMISADFAKWLHQIQRYNNVAFRLLSFCIGQRLSTLVFCLNTPYLTLHAWPSKMAAIPIVLHHRLIKTQIGHARDFAWYRGQRPSPARVILSHERVQIHARENLCSYATNPPHFCVRELLLCDI